MEYFHTCTIPCWLAANIQATSKKMKMILRPILKAQIFATLILVSTTCLGQQPAKEVLVGKWKFEKFEFTGELSDAPSEEQNRVNKINAGMVITFLTGNGFNSVQKGGRKVNNVTGRYKLLTDGKLIIAGDTLKISQLDESYLKLFKSSRIPIMVFKRLH
jgi:hypothetical protein